MSLGELITTIRVVDRHGQMRARAAPPMMGLVHVNAAQHEQHPQLAVLAEIIAILLAGRLLTTAGRPDAIMPAVAAIVGLHFFGLIRAFHSWCFAVVGAAMVLLAVLSFALPPSVTVGPGVRAAFVGLGCALCLWSGIAPMVVGTWRRLAAA